MSTTPTRRQLGRWIAWFFLINVFLCFLIQTTYIHFLRDLHQIYGATTQSIMLAWFFLFASYIAHASILNLFFAIPVALVAYFVPKRAVVFPLAAVLSATLLITHLVDRIAFSIFHMHNLPEAWIIINSGTLPYVIPLSLTETALLIFILVVVILCELGLGVLLWNFLKRTQLTSVGYIFSGFVLSTLIISYSIMGATVGPFPEQYRFAQDKQHLILRMARLVPYYTNVYQLFFPASLAKKIIVESHAKKIPVLTQAINRPLNYPQNPMQCRMPAKRPNILVIMLDTWRFQQMNAKATPNIAKFAQDSWQFDNHYSGGNCTEAGVFSLFYGMPSLYWNAMREQKKGPVLIKQLQKQGYEFAVYASAPLTFPEFEKTVFRDVKPLRLFTKASSTTMRDKTITENFTSFLTKRDPQKPFFSFVFFDLLHNYCEGSEWQNQKPFGPAVADCARFSLTNETDPTPYLNRYRNAAHTIDKQVGKILNQLKQRKLLDNTIVVITADHGTEFNDTHQGYWSHASAYNQFQIHVPMIIHWPGRQARHIAYKTSHMDFAATLMQSAMGCSNPASDMSVGHSMLDSVKRPYLICGSYNDYAVVTDQRITRIFPDGDYAVNHKMSQPVIAGQLDPQTMRSAFRDLQRFFRKPS